jgi:hypothetical protein
MNLDFRRYQRLPRIDVQALAAMALNAGNKANKPGTTREFPMLFPLPEGEGQGEGDGTARPSVSAQHLASFPR